MLASLPWKIEVYVFSKHEHICKKDVDQICYLRFTKMNIPGCTSQGQNGYANLPTC
jgi:hypothetical protein